MSSVRISTLARAVVYPDSEEKLVAILKTLKEADVPYVVVGRMSNVLFKNGAYDGVIIKTTKFNTNYVAEDKVTFLCGANLNRVIRLLAEKNLGGMEGLCGIPGTVGGMVKQNAGAFGYEIADRFTEAICYCVKTNSMRIMSKADMEFSYRDSILKREELILLNATFEPVYKAREQILAEIDSYKEKRILTQPIEYPSLGSVFKRNLGVGAGYYIDKVGLKGYSVGGARVSEKHAGFIVNGGGATADDYLKLIDCIKQRVYAVFGIELKEEVEII
jgi:UDP-N-acetylmuramate dehydrogenase